MPKNMKKWSCTTDDIYYVHALSKNICSGCDSFYTCFPSLHFFSVGAKINYLSTYISFFQLLYIVYYVILVFLNKQQF
jgi:hypothetical protein